MAEIHGTSGTALRQRIGSLAQVVRVDSFIEADGPARGARRLRLINGGGIELDVHPDRGFDIGQVTVDGLPIAWISPVGISGPEGYEPAGTGWLRTFGGGLLATCGLDSFGPPSEDAGQPFGQHGRFGTQKATIVRTDFSEERIVVEAVVRQAGVFAENFVLRRRISTTAGSDTVRIDDTVTNDAYTDQPHMILYHINLGWPLMDDQTRIDIPSVAVTPRDVDAAAGLSETSRFGPPSEGFREQVFIHDLDPDCATTVMVHNSGRGLEFALTVSGSELPALHQWRMCGLGHYVLGVEPSNTRNPLGRAAARAAGALPILKAGQSVHYGLEIRIKRVATP